MMVGVVLKGADGDDPLCPKCGYLLVGLSSRVCPECGTQLAADLSVYRPSRHPTPWCAHTPTCLLGGYWSVLRHPGRAFSLCSTPERVALHRAVVFACLCSVILIATWPLLRETAVYLSLLQRMTPHQVLDVVLFSRGGIRNLARPSLWAYVWSWEAWSLLRWWVLFGLLTAASIAISSRCSRSGLGALAKDRVARLCLFAPWIAGLEFAFMIAVCIYEHGGIVPEPSTLFARHWSWYVWLRPAWLARGVLPSFVVGVVFFRYVLCQRRLITFLAAVMLVPVAINLSIVWTIMYVHFHELLM